MIGQTMPTATALARKLRWGRTGPATMACCGPVGRKCCGGRLCLMWLGW